MEDPVYKTLYFLGYEKFRPGQENVIRLVLHGENTLAIFPTGDYVLLCFVWVVIFLAGGGKSLCYMLPSLVLKGLTVVISPLIALQKDQVDGLKEKGVRAASLNSSMKEEEIRRVELGVKDGFVQILFLAPERLKNIACRKMLMKQKIALFAVDESHCVISWGNSFRPEVS